MVCSLGSSSTVSASETCKLLISSCIAEMRVFASTRDFFKSSNTCSLVFTRSASFWASLLSSSIFFPLNQLPPPYSAFSGPGKPLRLFHVVEQALSAASRRRALDRWSLMVRCVLSGSFSFAEALIIGNRIFFCRHCSYYTSSNYRKRRSVRVASFFEDSNISLAKWLYVIYLWSIGESNNRLSLLTGLSLRTIVTVLDKIPKIFSMKILNGNFKLGGRGKIVEIDE